MTRIEVMEHESLMGAINSFTDQDTNAPAWPRVSVSPMSGYLRTDKQPLEVSEDTEKDKKAICSEKLTALGIMK